MSPHLFLYCLTFVAMGIALDGAFFWRFKNLLEAFYHPPKEMTYRHFMFPRLLLITFSSVLAAIGSYDRPTNAGLIIFAGVLFVSSSFYPHFLIYWKSKRM